MTIASIFTGLKNFIKTNFITQITGIMVKGTLGHKVAVILGLLVGSVAKLCSGCEARERPLHPPGLNFLTVGHGTVPIVFWAQRSWLGSTSRLAHPSRGPRS